MDISSIQDLGEFLSTGSIAAIFSILLAIIAALFWERIRLLKRVDFMTKQVIDSKKDEVESIRKIVDLYYHGNLNIAQALAEIKGVLSTIQYNNHRQTQTHD